VVALVPRGGFDTYALTQTPLQRAGSIWRNQTRVALRPARKAVHALGARLNRKPKRPRPLPVKKKSSDADRTV